MKIRIITMLNHYYSDQINVNERVQPLGRFCAFGYYDAVDVATSEVTEREALGFWHFQNNLSMQKMDGSFTLNNLVCAIDNEEKDQKFWKFNEDYPFFFFSFLRIDEIVSGSLRNLISEINDKENDTICYYTFEHAEIVIVHKTNSYHAGMRYIECLSAKFSVRKIHSIWVVEEDFLDSEKLSQMDERVCLRISAVVKKQENVEHYFRKLQSKLASDQIDYYNVLGNEDFLIEIDDIRLADLLPLYKTEGVLTHMDEAYDQAFYNLSSQIILKKGEYNGTAK